MIDNRTLQAADHGFAVDNDTITAVHGRIAGDRTPNYPTGLPSADTVRAFRACNRSLAYRVVEKVSSARLSAQNYAHIAILERELKKIDQDDPTLFLDPRRIWNWDKTAVSGEYGRKVRCYASSNTHHGGARKSIEDPGKHVTAGIAVAACGNIAPLFLIASGKRVVKAWKKPLDKTDFSNRQGVPHWLCQDGWLPSNTSLHVTKSGSVNSEIIVKVVEHIYAHTVKIVDLRTSILLFVDGHSSRNGSEWLEACEDMNIIVVRLPANTTHILQPCDQLVNKRFQQTVRSTRDELLSMRHLSWANTAYKIKLAVAGYQSITAEEARKYFVACGLWPMNYKFLDFFPRPTSNPVSTVVSGNQEVVEKVSEVVRTEANGDRRQNALLQERIHRLTDGSVPAFRALAEVSSILQSDYRVQKILREEISAPKWP